MNPDGLILFDAHRASLPCFPHVFFRPRLCVGFGPRAPIPPLRRYLFLPHDSSRPFFDLATSVPPALGRRSALLLKRFPSLFLPKTPVVPLPPWPEPFWSMPRSPLAPLQCLPAAFIHGIAGPACFSSFSDFFLMGVGSSPSEKSSQICLGLRYLVVLVIYLFLRAFC